MSSTLARRQPSTFHVLLWKEAVQLAPLFIGLVAVSTLMHLVLSLIPNGYQAYPAFLILIPNILALGAPAMTIGQEEESGTLRWTRDLPIDWRWSAGVKTMAAILGLALTWAFSIGVFALASPAPMFGGAEVFSVEAIGGAFFAGAFSLYLLGAGMAITWWLRTPIPSLLTTLPTVVVLFVAIILFGEALGEQGPRELLLFTVLLVSTTIVLFLLSIVAARRTLSAPWVRRSWRQHTASDRDRSHAYQQITVVPLSSPGPRFALLWQTFGQSWALIVPLLLVGLLTALLAFLLSFALRSYPPPVFTLLIPLAAVNLLGASVFVTENKQRRQRFLADRGVAPYTIWWTRQAIPLLACVIIVAPLWLLASLRWSHWSQTETLLLFANAFVCGQLSGQTMRRPIVGLLAAPVFFALSNTLAAVVWAIYPGYVWGGVAAVALLWLVTLRLCRRWSEERMSAGYYGRLAGWIALAALVFVGNIAVSRYATTPAAAPEWHAATLQQARELFAAEQEAPRNPVYSVDPQAEFPVVPPVGPNGRIYFPLPTLQRAAGEVIRSQRGVLGGASFANAATILAYLSELALSHSGAVQDSSSSTAKQERAKQVYQDWLQAMILTTRRSYQLSVMGDAENQAERFEAMAVAELERSDSREILGRANWNELVSLLPTTAERNQWRKNFLLRGWLSTQMEPPNTPFFSQSWGNPRLIIPAEQWRIGRFLDRAVRISMQQLDSDLPAAGSAEEAARLQAWRSVREELSFEGRYTKPAWLLPTAEWNATRDQQVQRLRQQADAES